MSLDNVIKTSYASSALTKRLWAWSQSNTGFFSIAFLMTLLVDLTVRLVVLPYILPQLHAGEGFMVGGDALGFHKKALELANHIVEGGWGQWQLKPGITLDAPVSWASAIYATFGTNPLFLMPFNALVHALAALLLMQIMNYALADRRAALFAALPFLLFPTAVYWHSQLHKDGMFILGLYFFLLGWICVYSPKKISAVNLFQSTLLIGMGLFCVWWVRAYFLLVLFVLSVCVAVVCTLGLIRTRHHQHIGWQDGSARFTWMVLVCIAVQVVLILTPKSTYLAESLPTPVGSEEVRPCPWKADTWAPKKLDDIAFSLVRTRNGYLGGPYLDAGSTVDKNICLDDIKALGLYLPRALQLSLLAPFPIHWVEQGSHGGHAMRLISGMEMLVVYGALIGLLIFLWREQIPFQLYIIGTFSVPALLLYAIVTPNLGALHRMRYGFLMLLVGAGIGLVARHLMSRRSGPN